MNDPGHSIVDNASMAGAGMEEYDAIGQSQVGQYTQRHSTGKNRSSVHDVESLKMDELDETNSDLGLGPKLEGLATDRGSESTNNKRNKNKISVTFGKRFDQEDNPLSHLSAEIKNEEKQLLNTERFSFSSVPLTTIKREEKVIVFNHLNSEEKPKQDDMSSTGNLKLKLKNKGEVKRLQIAE